MQFDRNLMTKKWVGLRIKGKYAIIKPNIGTQYVLLHGLLIDI